MAYHKPANPEPYPPISKILLAEISHLSGDFEAIEFNPENYPGYVVTANGQIWSVRKANSRQWGKPKQRKLAPYPKGGHFLAVALMDMGGMLVTHSVSKIVAAAFIGEPLAPDMIVIHVDGNIQNNHVSNLEWATWERFGENKAAHDSMKAQGEGIGISKLTNEQVLEIKRRVETERDADLASEFGVVRTVITKIRTGETWRQIGGKPRRQHPLMPQGEDHHFAKLNENDIREIRRLYVNGHSKEDLAQQFGIHPMYVYNIIRRKNWKHV